MTWNKVSQVRAVGYIVYSVKRQTLLECNDIVVSIGKLNGNICSDDSIIQKSLVLAKLFRDVG